MKVSNWLVDNKVPVLDGEAKDLLANYSAALLGVPVDVKQESVAQPIEGVAHVIPPGTSPAFRAEMRAHNLRLAKILDPPAAVEEKVGREQKGEPDAPEPPPVLEARRLSVGDPPHAIIPAPIIIGPANLPAPPLIEPVALRAPGPHFRSFIQVVDGEEKIEWIDVHRKDVIVYYDLPTVKNSLWTRIWTIVADVFLNGLEEHALNPINDRVQESIPASNTVSRRWVFRPFGSCTSDATLRSHTECFAVGANGETVLLPSFFGQSRSVSIYPSLVRALDRVDSVYNMSLMKRVICYRDQEGFAFHQNFTTALKTAAIHLAGYQVYVDDSKQVIVNTLIYFAQQEMILDMQRVLGMKERPSEVPFHRRAASSWSWRAARPIR
jgi:hypothetical protein